MNVQLISQTIIGELFGMEDKMNFSGQNFSINPFFVLSFRREFSLVVREQIIMAYLQNSASQNSATQNSATQNSASQNSATQNGAAQNSETTKQRIAKQFDSK